jgi:hypothetical protein
MTRRQDLLASLAQIQNHPAHGHHDILTIHHCAPRSTEAQLLAAIDANMVQVAQWSNRGGKRKYQRQGR